MVDGSGSAPHEEFDDRLGPRVARASQWRLQWRARWSDIRPLVIIAVAVTATVLGYIGFRHSPATESGGPLDALYRTVRLFGLAAGDTDPPVAWELQVARVLAPLLVGYAAIRGLAALFREQFLLLRLRLFARRHVVVAGLGEQGFGLISGLRARGISVVGIERVASNTNIAGCRERAIPVVIGDARDPVILRRARCDRASHVVALCGRDARNLDVLAACTELAEAPSWLPAWLHIEVEDLSLWRLLRISALTAGTSRLRVEFFSLTDLIARALVDAASTRSGDATSVMRNRIVIDGTGRLLQSVAAHSIRAFQAGGSDQRISLMLVGGSASDELLALEKAAPSIGEVADVTAYDVDPATDVLPRDLADAVRSSLVLVCLQEDSAALAHGAMLASAAEPGQSSDVFVVVSSEAFDTSLDSANIRPPGVTTVAANSHLLGPALLADTALEAIARAKHENYVRLELERGGTLESNPSLRSWDQLPETVRESNRKFADSVGEKIRKVGGALVPRQPAALEDEHMNLPPELMEELAQEEHERWMSDMVQLGWKSTPGTKDAARKVHPLLVPWGELPEPEREKDRDGIRALPEVLSAAGYKLVVRPGPVTGEQHSPT